MVSLRIVSLLFLAAAAQASSHDQELYELKSDHAARAERLARRQTGRVYTLTDSAEGPNFFDKWLFMTFDDPTHGLVQYVDRDTAFANKLAYVRDDGVAIMRVDNTTWLAPGQKRNSVRIHTQTEYGKGLFIADILQMPYGPSQWPAYWSNGANWPAGGEIDIIEGTQNGTSNQSTLHTVPGCTLNTGRHNPNAASFVSEGTFTGEAVGSNECNAFILFNAGCGIRNPDSTSYGYGFNANGGGVYATLWNDEGIRIWFFPRGAIPDDITNQAPNPDTWPAPNAYFDSSTCPMDQFFTPQSFIFNITLCGDLGNATFGEDGTPGTCQDWVTDPSHYRTAMWKVKSFRVYN